MTSRSTSVDEKIQEAAQRQGLIYLGPEQDGYILAARDIEIGLMVQCYSYDEYTKELRPFQPTFPQFWTAETARKLIAAFEAEAADA